MTRVLVAAASGASMAALTQAVSTIKGAHIVRYGSSRVPLGLLAESLCPDLVVIDDPKIAPHAKARAAEVRRAAPQARIVVVNPCSPSASVSGELHALAVTMMPSDLDPGRLGSALSTVVLAPVDKPCARADRSEGCEQRARSASRSLEVLPRPTRRRRADRQAGGGA
jgi:hypothetical protein